MTHKPTLSKLKQVPLRHAWKHEASEFTPWLAQQENLNELAATLGLSELTVVATEHWVGDFKLDILCTDGEQKVIIENQLEETDHKHLGQILAYAAGVEARKIIWIAETFRPEHMAALQFLNEHTTDDLSFFGVQIELWCIDDSPVAPKFEVVIKPNDWTKVGREQVLVATSASPTKQLQLRFWMALVPYLRTHAPQIRPMAPRPRHWLNTTIGRAGFGLNMTASIKNVKRLGIELYLSSQNAKHYFGLLYQQKDSIEKQLGFALDWQELPDSSASRIAYWLPDASIEDETRWPEYQKWFAHYIVKMQRVFHPIVRDLRVDDTE